MNQITKFTIFLTIGLISSTTQHEGETSIAVSRKRRAIDYASVTLGLELAKSFVDVAISVKSLFAGNSVDKMIEKELKAINGKLDVLDKKIDRVYETSQEMLRSLSHEGQWTRSVAVFGKDIQRLRHFSDQMKRLPKDSNWKFIVNQQSEEWADAVLSTGDDGIAQVLHDYHTFVTGENPFLGTKSILHIVIDSLPKSRGSLWGPLDKFMEAVLGLQVSGYISWALALSIKERSRAEKMRINGIFEERMNDQKQTIVKSLEDSRLRTWPKGTFGLVKVKTTGCPSGPGWAEGRRYHDTEDDESVNTWSNPLHMASTHSKNNMEWEFCMRQNSIGSIEWPKGSYCLFAKKGCPAGFFQGNIYFDDEDDNNKNTASGTLPDGDYTTNTQYKFCCRSDQLSSKSMKLPIDGPFILFPLHNVPCQEVYKMDVIEEWFKWDCEDDNNSNTRTRPHPKEADGGRNMQIHMCYYERVSSF